MCKVMICKVTKMCLRQTFKKNNWNKKNAFFCIGSFSGELSLRYELSAGVIFWFGYSRFKLENFRWYDNYLKIPEFFQNFSL
jgi:hypothetical protein